MKSVQQFRTGPPLVMRWLEQMRSELATYGHLIPPQAMARVASETALVAQLVDDAARRAKRVQEFLDRGGRVSDVVHLPDVIRGRSPDPAQDPAQLTLWGSPRNSRAS